MRSSGTDLVPAKSSMNSYVQKGKNCTAQNNLCLNLCLNLCQARPKLANCPILRSRNYLDNTAKLGDRKIRSKITFFANHVFAK